MSQQNQEPGSEIILYQTEGGNTRLEVKLENNTVWLTQKQMAELFQTTIPNVNMHLRNVYAEGELQAEATLKEFLIVRPEGNRQVSRAVEHYNLDAIIAVGYRVKSQRGTQFRIWATQRLSEYIIKGFVLDDERLKNPPGPGVPDYFDEVLERIRDIRASPPPWCRGRVSGGKGLGCCLTAQGFRRTGPVMVQKVSKQHR